MRRALPLDAPALAAIHAAAFPPDEAWDERSLAVQLTLPAVFGLIDEAGGMVLARVAADEAEILTLAVAPSARRRGLGTALLTEATDIAARCGAVRVFLEVSAVNVQAGALYAKAGFCQIACRSNYYPDGSDAKILSVRITSMAGPTGSASEHRFVRSRRGSG